MDPGVITSGYYTTFDTFNWEHKHLGNVLPETENSIITQETMNKYDVCWWNSGWLPWNKGIWGEHDSLYDDLNEHGIGATANNLASYKKIDLNDGLGNRFVGMVDAGGHCTSGAEPPGGWIGRDCSGTCVGIEANLGRGDIITGNKHNDNSYDISTKSGTPVAILS